MNEINSSIFNFNLSSITNFATQNKKAIAFVTAATSLTIVSIAIKTLFSKETISTPQPLEQKISKPVIIKTDNRNSLDDTIFDSSNEPSLQGSFDKAINWSPRNITQDIALEKMWKNGNKAVIEHRRDPFDESAYLPESKALPSLDSLKNNTQSTSLNFEHHFAERQGVRPTMEDAHLYLETKDGILAVICDGHGGKEVAKFATEYLKNNFDTILKDNQNNVHAAFEIIINEIEQEIEKNKAWDDIGSTLVMSYVDKKSNLVYTATLGDSEANIYRKTDNNLLSIALSCVRDWTSTKDAKRAGEILKDPNIAKKWPHVQDSKTLRFPHAFYGVNVARALGDHGINKLAQKNFSTQLDGVSHKPKITVNKVNSGDVLILACDGLKDYVSENEITEVLSNITQESEAAQKLVDFAIDTKKSKDNVSVLAIYIK